MGKKVVLVFTVLSLFIFSQSLSLAEERGFRFSNWPLENFENRQILFSFGKRSHKGVDVDAKVGEDVRAVADGKVYWTFSKKPHGLAIGIDHENGWRTTYLHLSKKLVKKGQKIKANQVLGKVGVGKVGTGDENPDSVKPHLHFGLNSNSKVEIWNGKHKDPLAFGPLAILKQNTSEQKVFKQQEKHLPKVSQSEVSQSIVGLDKSTVLQQTVSEKLRAKLKQNIKNSALKARPTVSAGSYQKETQKSENEIRHKISNKFLQQAKLALSNALTQYKAEAKTKSTDNTVNDSPLSKGYVKEIRSANNSTIVLYWLLLAVAAYLYNLTDRGRKRVLSSIFAT